MQSLIQPVNQVEPGDVMPRWIRGKFHSHEMVVLNPNCTIFAEG